MALGEHYMCGLQHEGQADECDITLRITVT